MIRTDFSVKKNGFVGHMPEPESDYHLETSGARILLAAGTGDEVWPWE